MEAKYLKGETIKSARLVKHSKDCDSVNVLRLTMKSGKVFEIEGSYGGYTGKSCDEYIEVLEIREVTPPIKGE